MRAFRILLFTVCLLAVLPVSTLRSQESHDKAPVAPSLPFAADERLAYRVQWDPPWYLFFLPLMDAGELELQWTGETDYKGKKAVQVSFKAHSSGTLVKMAGMKVDDEFEFISEPDSLCSLSVSKKVREGKRKRQIDVEYLRETHQLHIREMDESIVPPKIKRDEVKNDIPSCVQDPFSAIYSLRKDELQLGQERTFLIGHDDRVKEIKTRVEKLEAIETAAGKLQAWNVRPSALMGGLFKEGGQFRLWLSADQRRVPLQFEVKVSLGKVVGKLKAANFTN